VVSEARMSTWAGWVWAEARAFSRARRRTYSAGVSPGRGLSSISAGRSEIPSRSRPASAGVEGIGRQV
jgi:hypothetical protein